MPIYGHMRLYMLASSPDLLVSPGAEARGVIVQEWGGGVMNSDCHADSWGLVLEWFAHPGRADATRWDCVRSTCLLATGESRATSEATGRIDLQHASSGLTVRALTTHQRRGVSEQLSDLFQFAAEAAPAPIAATVHGDLRRLQRGIAGRCIRGDGIPDPCARHRRRGATCIASCA